MSPSETDDERLNDFSVVQITDDDLTYITAVAVVPADAAGDPAGIRAFVRAACGGGSRPFTELTTPG